MRSATHPTHSRLSLGRLAALTTTALVSIALAVTDLYGIAPPARAVTPAPAGGFALAGGLAGSVDPRTGQFTVSLPIATADGAGSSAVPVALNWQQARAAASIDRSGWGAGWTIGSSFVSVAGLKRVYPSGGGSYLLDPTEPSGLKDYKLHDLAFATHAGTLAARTGAKALTYAYTLTYDDGHIDYFDANGNLGARVDRYGNRTDITWRARANDVWQPTSIVDSYGLATTFDYSTADVVKIIEPKRSDGVTPATTIALTAGSGVQSVTDAVGQKTSFGYASVSGAPKPLLTKITAPSGAKTAVSYHAPSYEPSLTVVDTLTATDAQGTAISPPQTFSLDPDGNNRHNFTGYPNHLSTATSGNVLFESGDAGYTYSTSLTTGSTTTLTTYDALDRLVKRVVSVVPAVGAKPLVAQTQVPTYDTPVRVPGNLPANFSRPEEVALTQSSQTNANGITAAPGRTTTTHFAYDDHGRVTSQTNEVGATTTTSYDDRYGQVVDQTTVAADHSEAKQANTLTADGRNILTATTSAGEAGKPLTARQKVTYGYDAAGQLTRRTLDWAEGAKPADDGPGGGPDQIVTTFARSVDTATASEKLTTTVGAGTSAAEATTSDIDLVTGEVTKTTDGLGRSSVEAFDALGRPTRLATPDGLTTTTAYTPTSKTVTSPDGRKVKTTVDLLGRTTSVTDNVADGKLTTDPTSRTLTSTSYSADGSTVTGTDQNGAVTKEMLDPFGRVVRQVSPTGVEQLTSYDNGAAHDKTDQTLPAGTGDVAATTRNSYDDANRTLQSATTYSGNQADPVVSATFNGLGQTATSTDRDLTVTPERSGAGGVESSATARPTATSAFPGTPVTATTERDLTGAVTSRTLKQGDDTSTAVSVTYDAAGQITATTDPAERVTRYTYNADGQSLSKTDPSGAVTTYTYDKTSGLRTGVTVTAPGKATRTITYTWVPNGEPGAGQLKTVSDGAGTVTYEYDAEGHRTSIAYPDGTATRAAYNGKGQLTSTTDVTGAVTTYTWDDADRMHSATQQRGSAVLASEIYTYDALSRLATTTHGNGTVTTEAYTPNDLVASETTKAADGSTVEAHSYTYDAHRDPATRTDTYRAGSSVAVPGSSATTWTTAYTYDAYDRLVDSKVYVGGLVDGKPTGLPTTSTAYTVDVGGDVKAKAVTTYLPGPVPAPATTTTTNTIDPSGRLVSQKTGTTSTSQHYDDDGRVVTGLDGNVTTYTADGAPASVTLPNGSKTVYGYWPDGSRRSIKTTGPDGRVSTVTLHYGTDGNLVNDTTQDAGTGARSAATASYLLTTGRDARTLLPGTAASGAVADTPEAPITTGTGTGYYLRDRHSSVTAQVDSAGTVTSSYAYTDYGAPARADGQPLRVTAAPSGRANPYTYLGAAPGGPWTSAVTGLLVFSMRSYNAATGRFTSPDPVDAHNLYQGFETNPIANADLAGGISTPDIVLDCVFAFVFAASIVLSFGAAAAAVGAAVAAYSVAELTAGVVINVAANAIGVAANVTGAVTSSLLAADDIVQAASQGKATLFSADTRSNISFANDIATLVGGATGVVAGLTDFTVGAAEEATEAAAAVNRAAQSPKPASEAIGTFEVYDFNEPYVRPVDDPPLDLDSLFYGDEPVPDVVPQDDVRANQPEVGQPVENQGDAAGPRPPQEEQVSENPVDAGERPNLSTLNDGDAGAAQKVPKEENALPAPNSADLASNEANNDVPEQLQTLVKLQTAVETTVARQIPQEQVHTNNTVLQEDAPPTSEKNDPAVTDPARFVDLNTNPPS